MLAIGVDGAAAIESQVIHSGLEGESLWRQSDLSKPSGQYKFILVVHDNEYESKFESKNQ